MFGVSVANAQPRAENYRSEGAPMLQGITYKTWAISPGVGPEAAFERGTRAVLAEGFVNVNAGKRLGTLTAQQETSGSGRSQTLRVVVGKSGKGSRIDAVFMVQGGQAALSMSDNLCRIVDAVVG
ncbi:hypothetical protein CIW48_22760 [Methylobacterium sp. P1-11]|nr:hypothetical protein CIW48_22760 [Methylobacterium sp. P1-11]